MNKNEEKKYQHRGTSKNNTTEKLRTKKNKQKDMRKKKNTMKKKKN